jgi:hypothetical protein
MPNEKIVVIFKVRNDIGYCIYTLVFTYDKPSHNQARRDAHPSKSVDDSGPHNLFGWHLPMASSQINNMNTVHSSLEYAIQQNMRELHYWWLVDKIKRPYHL